MTGKKRKHKYTANKLCEDIQPQGLQETVKYSFNIYEVGRNMKV